MPAPCPRACREPPVGETAAVLVEAPNLGETEGGTLVRLDETLAPLGSEPFVHWQYTLRD